MSGSVYMCPHFLLFHLTTSLFLSHVLKANLFFTSSSVLNAHIGLAVYSANLRLPSSPIFCQLSSPSFSP
jgi:hypothetical protein